jgi:hypothetical protein
MGWDFEHGTDTVRPVAAQQVLEGKRGSLR